uniref:Rhodanese domain-containing protein n=1 Tax=Globodera pallida TaxID=36090 RepID=A0A183BIF6_GLOPA
MSNGVGTGRVQWRHEHPQQLQGKQDEQQQQQHHQDGDDELEENHYEDGDDGGEECKKDRIGMMYRHQQRQQKTSLSKVGIFDKKVQPLPPKVPPLPPPLPPPKLFGNAKRELKPFGKTNLARFWPALAFLAFCLILLSIAFLSLWVANNNSEMRRKNQMNWPLRLVPMPTSTVSATTPHKVPSKVLPPATLSGQKGGGEGGEEEEEEEEEEVSEAPATSPAWTSSEALVTMEMHSATPSSPWASSSSLSAPEASHHQFVVQPEELVRWLDDGQIRRRLRLFEVRDRNSFPTTPAALPPAKVLLLSSLSHNGVPVHPLQFQRFLRSEEVDDGSVVVLYDVQSSQQLWAHYALWIFRLFGLDNSLLLMGGPNWTVNGTSLITLLKGLNVPPNVSPGHSPVGIFQAQWRAEFIATFDDVLANFEGDNAANANAADIVDAQTEKEFDGRAPSVPGPASSASGAIFGHIRGAKSVPVETLAGLAPEGQRTLFHAQFGLSPARPIIVYDGFSSHRAAFVWTALRRANFSAELYFGAWPEWLVRAPDHLKVIPDN